MTDAQPFLPYSCPQVDEADIEAVVQILRQGMISQGAQLPAFETAFAAFTDAPFAVAYSSGSAALHGMCAAAGLGAGDEVITTALSFSSTANAILHTGARPVFADIDPFTYGLAPEAVAEAATERTRAILTVDFGGNPSDYAALRALANRHDWLLLADAAHAAGAQYNGKPVGSPVLADMTAFSFNPVKNMTSIEGGMVTTGNPAFASVLRKFRVSGMTRTPDELLRPSEGDWYYEQHLAGFNYKMHEVEAVLGLRQLSKLPAFNDVRRRLAAFYDEALADLPLQLPATCSNGHSVYHLYPVLLHPESSWSRAAFFAALKSAGLGVQVHYIPIPMHPFYAKLGYTMEDLPETAAYYTRAVSIPLHHGMTPSDAERVAQTLHQILRP